MAINCEDILGIESCKKMKFVSGKNGLKREISWPYVKTIDNFAEWLYGDELVFVLDEKKKCSEKDILGYMEEAIKAKISGLVFLVDGNHEYEITDEVKRFTEKNNIVLFILPYSQRLIDITKDISNLILTSQIQEKNLPFDEDEEVLEMLLNGRTNEEILFHCFRKLQPLKEADRIAGSELVKTLYMFLQNGNDGARTSEKLFIHRNTMNGRLKKINALLKTNVNNPLVRTEYLNVFNTLEYMGMEVF